MFKLFRKKSKKGFTLAELLVVVAIIAILVAIAIPIFTGSLKEAQIRVNEANIRTVKGAGVSNILSNWTGYDNTKTTAKKMSTGVASGWDIVADVDAKGDISNLKIFVTDSTAAATGITADKKAADAEAPESTVTAATSKDDFSKLAPPYMVQVHVDNLDYTPGTAPSP